MRRVVVSGLGLVTPLGVGAAASWARLVAGATGTVALAESPVAMARADAALFDKLPSRIAAVVPGFALPASLDGVVDKGKLAPFMSYALAAAAEALEDAGLAGALSDAAQERAGVAIGTGIGGIDHIVQTGRTLTTSGYKRVSPYFVPRILGNMAAGHVSMAFGLRGPNHTASTACATGAHAIGDAARFIQYGDADVMVAGGTEACIDPVSMAGFCRMNALASKFNDDPARASRPFDRDRAGFVMGEGAGILVLEELEHAKRRGANIYAEVAGYGPTGDAFHITAPSGDGARRCMLRALESAGLRPADIGYINAHATSTKIGDQVENRAIKEVFGDAAAGLCVSSTKGAVGHLLGAAGAVEAAFTALAIRHQIAPPTANLDAVDDPAEFSLDYVPGEARDCTIDAALTNSFGFGGTNASLALKRV